MNKYYLLLLGIVGSISVNAQFAPQVGEPGNTAIYKDSSVFIAWAKSCTLKLGWQNIADTSLGKAQVGDATYVPGKAGNGVVSLGDGGEAIVQFEHPIVNGVGYDFAVFENGFKDQTLAPGTAFLELAFVEVSSDGIHYTRFAATSLNDTANQLQSFEGMDAKRINNLAGKYLANYGTPFDLDELKDSPDLDVNHITHIKIMDVVGSLNDSFATHDALGNKVNDPWPTPFASSGFDLDAVGVIHHDITQSVNELFAASKLTVSPNPATVNRDILINTLPNSQLRIYDALGNEYSGYKLSESNSQWILQFSQCGFYFLVVQTENGNFSKRLLIQ